MAGHNVSPWLPRRPLALVATISLVMIALFALDLGLSRGHILEYSRSVSEALSRLFSDSLDASIREIDQALMALIDRIPPSGLPQTASRDRILSQSLAEKRASLPQASCIAVLGPDGSLLASDPPKPGLHLEASTVRALSENPGLDGTILAVFAPEKTEAGPALIRARTARGASGAPIAIVAAWMELTAIQAGLARLELGARGSMALFDSQLRLMASRPEQPAAIGAQVATEPLRGLLLSLGSSGPGPRSLRSETGPVFSYLRAGEFPIFVVLSESRASVLEDWNKRLLVYAGIAAALSLLFVLLARLVDSNLKEGAELAARFVAIESASDMIVIADLEGRAQYTNPAFERTTGISWGRAQGSRGPIFGPDEAEAVAALAAAAAGESWRGEVSALRAEGGTMIEEVTIAPVPGPGGKPIGIVAILRDVTERRRRQDQLERLAHYDSLTTLPNRDLFLDRLEGAVSRARREERRFALLFVDLDGFKSVNDHYGHDAGDYLLSEVARRLKAAIRDSDTAGRMGGDEFTVLLDNISRPDDAAAVADKLRSSLSEPIDIPSGPRVRVGASVGVAVFPDDGTDGSSIIKAADLAMYSAKIAGGHA